MDLTLDVLTGSESEHVLKIWSGSDLIWKPDSDPSKTTDPGRIWIQTTASSLTLWSTSWCKLDWLVGDAHPEISTEMYRSCRSQAFAMSKYDNYALYYWIQSVWLDVWHSRFEFKVSQHIIARIVDLCFYYVLICVPTVVHNKVSNQREYTQKPRKEKIIK